MSRYEDNPLAARFAALAPETLPPDWGDVLGRAGAAGGERGRPQRPRGLYRRHRRVVVLAAAAAAVALLTASAFGMRAFLDRGFVGLPPPGATPSSGEPAELEIFYWVTSRQLRRAPTGPWDGNLGRSRAWLYADGRLIWLREADLPEGANPFSTGFLEQRLNPEGVELLRSEIVSTAVLGHGERRPGSESLPVGTRIEVREGDRLVPVTWADDHKRLEERLTDPASWLPARAWQDRRIRAYVPSRFAACYAAIPSGQSELPTALGRIFAVLPARARDVLRARNPRVVESRGAHCSDLTTAEARALADALDRAGLEREGPSYGLAYKFEVPGPRPETALIFLEPYLPHGDFTCSACG